VNERLLDRLGTAAEVKYCADTTVCQRQWTACNEHTTTISTDLLRYYSPQDATQSAVLLRQFVRLSVCDVDVSWSVTQVQIHRK